MSLLFPMEKLFERYVEGWLRGQLLSGAALESQADSEHLCGHGKGRIFRLKPDLLIEYRCAALDFGHQVEALGCRAAREELLAQPS